MGMTFTNRLRKNIGTITALLGFILLCIITFGDLGELFAEQYWENVLNNLTSIGFMSIGLTCIQTVIKAGLAEQALQRGLNTPMTSTKYEEHRNLIKANVSKMQYLPYFLQIYNKKHTKLRKQEFLVHNNYSSEAAMLASGSKRLIKAYNNIIVHITPASIKWSTIDIVYDKRGRIITLDDHRRNRTTKQIVISIVSMIGVTFLTNGLFFSPSAEPLWQKFVKLFTYIVSIAIGAIFTTIKEYEKGAFGVPNDLDEINQIWHEFETWEVPDWVVKEVEEINKSEEVNCEERKSSVNERADLQKEQNDIEVVQFSGASVPVFVSSIDDTVRLFDDEEQCGECDGNNQSLGQREIYGFADTRELPVSDR